MELMRNKSHRTGTVGNLEMAEPHTSHVFTFIIPPEVDNWTPLHRDIAALFTIILLLHLINQNNNNSLLGIG